MKQETLSDKKIKCAMCNCDLGTEITASKEELYKNFGKWEMNECEIVCDDCYKKVLIWKKETYN